MNDQDRTQKQPEQPGQPEQTPPAPRRLLRAHDDRVLGGVAGGLARYFSIDPIIFRIGFVASIFVGALGIVAYVAALLFVPLDDGRGHPVPQDRSRPLAIAVVAVLALASLFTVGTGLWWLGFGAVVPVGLVAALGVGLYLLMREGGGDSGGIGRVAVVSALVLLGLAAASALLVGSAWAAATGAGEVVAVAVVVLGVALVVAAFRGGPVWLAIPALLLALPLGVVAAADLEIDGSIGERHYRPASAATIPVGGYELGAGELTVDLRDLAWSPATPVDLDVELGVGALQVLVPDDVCVQTDTHVGIGYSALRGAEADGVDLDQEIDQPAARGVPLLRLNADVAMGAIEIDDDPHDSRHYRDRFDDDDEDLAREHAEAVCRGRA